MDASRMDRVKPTSGRDYESLVLHGAFDYGMM